MGNLDAKRDWGYAREYVEGMYLMLQHDTCGSYVLATNKSRTVRDFAELAFKAVGVDIEWNGKAENEVGVDAKTGKTLVRVNPEFYRPTEVDALIGCADKAKRELNWEAKTTLEDLCSMMVKADLERNKSGFCF